jgi:monofunctional chorismate mutase
MDKELLKLRKQIDNIDDKIFLLLKKRQEIVKKVGKYKKKKGMPIVSPRREKEIIAKRIKNSGLNSEFIVKFYKLIFNNSYSVEKNICQKKSK